MVLRSIPVTRSISRWLHRCRSSVAMVVCLDGGLLVRLQDVHSLPPLPGEVSQRPANGCQRRRLYTPSPITSGGGVCGGHRWGSLGGHRGLRKLAAREPVLVVIDQLDALADLVVQHSGRLRVLLDLVQELADVPGLHIVLSCRSFEQRHDPALRDVVATALSLELPPWTDVLPIIEARGLQAANWNEDIREVLRSPHALDTFLTLLEGASEPEALRSFHGLLEQQWSRHVSSDSTGRRRATILHLARLMADREVLGLPIAIVDDHLEEIRSLTAAGLLRIDQALGRVEFRHQTLYEFVRARSFLEESGRLTDAVRLHQSSLRVRPQLWHALGYFRSASPEDYGTEIERLWSADIRPHLKMLLIEFLGRQTSPIVAEQRLALESMDDPWFRPRFLGAAVGSPGWFSTLAPVHLPALMSTAEDQSQLLVPLLDSALKSDATTVFDLVTRYWLFDSAKDILSWRVLGMGSLAPQTGPWVDSLVLFRFVGHLPVACTSALDCH